MPGVTVKYESDGSHLPVADQYWDSLKKKDRTALANMTFFDPLDSDLDSERLRFRFLNEVRCVDFLKRCLLERIDNVWIVSDDPLLTLVTVIYLNNISAVYPMGQDIVGVKDLKENHFFTGPHELRLDPFLSRYGHDREGFKRTAESRDGCSVDMADVAYRLLPFPRVPLYYLLWRGDEEFEPTVKVLFDRSIENTFPADAIWGLVNRVTMALLDL